MGALIVRDGEIVGEGFHHVAGAAHAEVEALRVAGGRAQGATMYVSLEPCNHTGKTPPCSRALIDAGVTRVVIGTLDPNPKTARGGVQALESAGVAVTVLEAPAAKHLIEAFARAIIKTDRPYVVVKMASSIDGCIAQEAGTQHWLTGPQAKSAVRDLRIAYDAVMVGAGTVRIDNPQLTVRPPHTRLRPYVRVVVCETATLPADRAVFAPVDGYDRTIILAPTGIRDRFAALQDRAEIIFAGAPESRELSLVEAMGALRARGISSVLCEGGPTLAGRLVAAGLVDRFVWLVAPVVLGGSKAVRVLNPPPGVALPSIAIDTVERVGDDLLLSGTVASV